jgi:hypothetical protein
MTYGSGASPGCCADRHARILSMELRGMPSFVRTGAGIGGVFFGRLEPVPGLRG